MDTNVVSSGILCPNLPESQRPRLSQVSACDDVPVMGSQNRAQIVQQSGEACRSYGFFQVINHGVAAETVEKIEEVAHEFFRLPVEEKMKYVPEWPSNPSSFKQFATNDWIRSKVLGGGAHSIVYRAIPVAPQRGIEDRAIKSSRPYMSSFLQREESVLKIFRGCPEILQCYGGETIYVNDHSVHNLLLEFAPHGTLAAQIEKNAFLESEARVYTRKLLKGLSCIHRRGFVHCDLKPENILLFPPSSQEDGASYQPKIADFGLSKTPHEYCNPDYWKLNFRGTPFYMSPESVAFGEIEAPLDIWSLGCIVIEMITGLPAWWKLRTVENLMFKLAFGKEAPVIPNGVSQNCRDFLNKCFMKGPNQRWTADMLLNHPFVKSRRCVYSVNQAFSYFGHYS